MLGGARDYRAGSGNGQGRQADREKWITTGRSLPHPVPGRSDRMAAMPTPSEHTRLSLEQRLGEHARTAWPQLTDLHVRHRGQFAYVAGELADGDTVKPMRLRYGGAASRWGFAPTAPAATRSDQTPRTTPASESTPEGLPARTTKAC